MGRIVLDSLDKRMTIPVVNYYHKKGYEIDGICFDDTRMLSKKYIREIHYVSNNQLEEDLETLLRKYSPEDYLILGNPRMIEAVNRIEPNIKYIIPPLESIRIANDKRKLMELASKLGIKTPRELAAPEYPMIVKLNISEGIPLKPIDRYKIVRNEDEYHQAMERFRDYKENVIMQEYIEGNGYGVSLLFDYDSDLVDYIAHERILEYPVTGGPSALCRSIYNEKLVKDATKLLKELNWQGLSMVEFKGDTLIEINPRFWGSLPLVFVAQSEMFTNLIRVLENAQTKIEETQCQYEIDKYMSYFPQCWISVIMNIKEGNVRTAMGSIPKILKSKEGIFMLSNIGPFFRYLKTLFE